MKYLLNRYLGNPMTAISLYVYIVIMYSMHVELAVSLSMLAIWYEQCRYAYT